MNSTSADFQNLYQALSRSAARSPDALALAFEDRRYLYRDFHLRVQRAMAQLDRGWSPVSYTHLIGVQLGKTFRVLLQFSQHLGYRAMAHAKAAHAKLVQRTHRGQIANAPGAFDIDSAFKLVGDDADFFHRGAGGRPAGRG